MSGVPGHVWGNVPEGMAESHCGTDSLPRPSAEYLHPEPLLPSKADERPAGQAECSTLKGEHRETFVESSHLGASGWQWGIYCQISLVWPLYQA